MVNGGLAGLRFAINLPFTKDTVTARRLGVKTAHER
jgi:hypothetical protein